MVTRRVTLLLAAMAAAVLVAIGTALAETAPQGTLDANNLAAQQNGQWSVATSGGQEYVVAQQFTAESTGTLISAQVRLSGKKP